MNQEPIKLLIAEDEHNLSLVLQKELTRRGCQVTVANDGETAIKLAREQEFHVALLDLMLPGSDGLSILQMLREQDPAPEVLMMTGHATVETALSAMKLGAYDYLTKPCNLTELTELIRKAYEKSRLQRENLVLKNLVNQRTLNLGTARTGQMMIVTRNRQMLELLDQVTQIAPSNAPVLIAGESGVGKELVARAIHRASPRAEKPFVDLNCAAVSETLVESELFGHEAGAFTSARTRKLGLFELANHGTLFLDEISELSPPLQSKLLRVLETMNFFRVGGTRKVEVDVRIIAATNVDLASAVKEGRFRRDLFFRINSIQLIIPPLRERVEDILLIAQHFLKLFAPHRRLALSPEAQHLLLSYHWPGNVRELRNMMERAVLLAKGDVVEPKDLPVETASQTIVLGMMSGTTNRPRAVDCGPGEILTPPFAETTAVARLEEVEKRQILAALERTNWHQGKAAKLLGISPSTLYRRLRAYKLSKRAIKAQRSCG
jgi:DNA-binding NtrC family response regulator